MKKKRFSQTREELLVNTTEYYNSTNRGIDSMGNCQYFTPDGKPCAIGREVKNPKELQQISDNSFLGSCGVARKSLFNKLPKRLQKMNKFFLKSIQALHDRSDNWDKNGLSKLGILTYNDIIDEYSLTLSYKEYF